MTEKCVTVTQNMIQVEKCFTVRKMCHSHKKVSQLEKCVAVRKYAVLENWVKTMKMAWSHLEKCFTVMKIG